MPDYEPLLRQLAAEGGNEQLLSRLRQALQGADTKALAQTLQAQKGAAMRNVVQQAQSGHLQQAAQQAQSLLQTPEGAALARQLQALLFPK